MWSLWGNPNYLEWVTCTDCHQQIHEVMFDHHIQMFENDQDGEEHICECCYRARFPLKPFESITCLHCVAQERQTCITELMLIHSLGSSCELLKPLMFHVWCYAFDYDRWLRFCPEMCKLVF